jgi:hypothetical protein
VLCSELELEGELDRAGAADLVEGVEAAVGAAGTQAVARGLRRAAEQGAGQVVVGIAEVGVIQDVGAIVSRFKREPFGKTELMA